MKEELKITQIRCRQLPDTEKTGKGIHPYVCVTFRGETRRTDWKEQGFNPTFIDQLGFSLKGHPIISDDFVEIEVKVHEFVFVKDRLLGTAKIFLTPLVEGVSPAPLCCVLNDADDNATDGEIDFIAVYEQPVVKGAGRYDSDDNDSEINDKADVNREIGSFTKRNDRAITKMAGKIGFARSESKVEGTGSTDVKTTAPKRRMHELADRPMYFQVKIRIIKGRHLIGTNIYPSVRVTIDGERRWTKPSRSSYQPFFNESFVFNFNERPNSLFDKIVWFEVHNKKGILSKDAIIGSFSCDLGTFYFEKDHAVLKKWLLLTVPHDENDADSLAPQGSPAGFLQINAIVLGTGDELPEKVKVTAGIDDIEDIESNLLLPIGGASLETATFFIKVYRCEDLPQMDPNLSKLPFATNKNAEFCDPYCTFEFAGRSVRTSIKKETYSPEFNEELKISYKYPSMCERLKLQLFDWDRTSRDDFIGTSFISLHELSGLGDPEFLPSFGPSFVCCYGSPREYSHVHSDEGELMDKGLIDGAFYRGRVLVEISSALGSHDKKPSKGIQEMDFAKVEKLKNRRKYMLFVTFMRGNMVDTDDNLIDFEVSIGTYGDKSDNSNNLKYSSTLPVHPISYGNDYYYLPWHASKPCCIVESHWEDIRIRLEPKIFLANIVHKLNKNIEKLHMIIKTKSKESFREAKTEEKSSGVNKTEARSHSETNSKEKSKSEERSDNDNITDEKSLSETKTEDKARVETKEKEKSVNETKIEEARSLKERSNIYRNSIKKHTEEKSHSESETEEKSLSETSIKEESESENKTKEKFLNTTKSIVDKAKEKKRKIGGIMNRGAPFNADNESKEITLIKNRMEEKSLCETRTDKKSLGENKAKDKFLNTTKSIMNIAKVKKRKLDEIIAREASINTEIEGKEITLIETENEEIPLSEINDKEKSLNKTNAKKKSFRKSLKSKENFPIKTKSILKKNTEEKSSTEINAEEISSIETDARERPFVKTKDKEEVFAEDISIAKTKEKKISFASEKANIEDISLAKTKEKKISFASEETNDENSSATETKGKKISFAAEEANVKNISTTETKSKKISFASDETNVENISVTESKDKKTSYTPVNETITEEISPVETHVKSFEEARAKKISLASLTAPKIQKESLTLSKVLRQLIDSFDTQFPIFEPDDIGVTPLDIQIQKTRLTRLAEIVDELVSLHEEPPELNDESILLLKAYSRRLEDLCIEPQMSLPDIVISMMMGGKTIAYQRIPTYSVMFSPREQTKGMYCGKLQNVMLKYLDEEDKDAIPVSLDLIVWFGLEDHQDDWIKNEERESKHSIFAETFENQWRITGKWTTERCPRPSFSDINGNIRLEKDYFIPPTGWKWEGNWFVAPEFDEFDEVDNNQPTIEVLHEIFENEKRSIDHSNWERLWHPSEKHWTDEQNRVIDNYNESLLPDGWMWEPYCDWEVDKDRACDEEGWGYCSIPVALGSDWSAHQKPFHRFRRRRYIRKRIIDKCYTPPKKELENKENAKETGWSYASAFGQFHKTKKSSDLSRRKRWRRLMIADIEEKPGPLPFFSIPSKDKNKPPHLITPRVFSVFKEYRMWQLRAYIYSARNIIGMNEDSTSDAFCKVTFQNRSYLTRIIYKSLSPVWDETVIFDSVPMYGNPDMIIENPPFVNVELYDDERVGSNEFIGRCLVQPHVRQRGLHSKETGKLLWYPIKISDFDGGELLAAFSLFLNEGIEPERPSVSDNRYIIPETIRPKVIRTGVEVLIWGVRNLKTFQMAPCTSPQVVIEIGGQLIKSDVIKNIRKTPNFPKNDYFETMMLPKDPFYMPPINIRVYDHRTWGRKPLVGTHVIKDVELVEPPTQENIDMTMETSGPAKEDNHYVSMDNKTDLQAIITKRALKQEDREEDYLDWWSKYYASCGDHSKCGKYLEKGYKPIDIYKHDLEEVKEYGGLDDIIDTFLLERGREDEEDEEAGEFKGNYKLYPLPEDATIDVGIIRYFSSVKPITKPIECTVRVYVIRGIELNPTDTNGKCDPYLVIQLGGKKISNSENRIPCTVDPYFGQFYQLKAKIPVVKDLIITVMDHDYGTQNDLIGSTTIDLENRLLSKARATVGLSPQYFDSGPYRWRDSKTPKQILKEVSPVKPVYERNEEILQLGQEIFKLSEFEETKPTNPHFGPPGERLALHVLHKKEYSNSKLVPEHVETRTLKDPFDPSVGQGELQLFVDIFPNSNGNLPPPLNIKPRTPRNFVLRVIIWGTAEVPLEDTNIVGEEMTDIYIQGWLGNCKVQKTDVHHRSLNGEGLFNWRMTYPFKYMPEESVMIVEEKEHFWSVDKAQEQIPPLFTVEVWDHDMFSSNDYIGKLELNLNKIPRPKQTKGSCKPSMLRPDKPTIDLFEKKHIKGWWVMTEREKDDTGTGKRAKKGEVEMTLEVLTEAEAKERPAGNGREEPNANPKLDEPNRPDTSFLWFQNPLNSFRYIIWRRFKWHIICLLLLVIFIVFLGLFIAGIIEATAKSVVE